MNSAGVNETNGTSGGSNNDDEFYTIRIKKEVIRRILNTISKFFQMMFSKLLDKMANRLADLILLLLILLLTLILENLGVINIREGFKELILTENRRELREPELGKVASINDRDTKSRLVLREICKDD